MTARRRGLGGAAAAAIGAAVAACADDPRCPTGEVWLDGACVAPEWGDPVPAGDAWQPAPGVALQWQLSGQLDATAATDLGVEMFDLDLFDAPDPVLDALHADGAVVVCYFSAGTVEDWREDVDALPDAAIGEPLPEWDGERWLDVMHPAVRELAEGRLDHAVARGCDAVEPDNVDAYANDHGLGLNPTEQLHFNRFLADAAHRRGLSVGLKNDLDQLEDLEPWFDWALNEECASYDECARLGVFTGGGKAAFHVEYVDDWAEAPGRADEVCDVGPDLDTLIKHWDLDARRLACP